jgi:murein DD-endopeptidase MepM/ murein hydrolase activator NlpD
VSPGQRVAAGTIVGVSGVTGYTTGEHLHFEIRKDGAAVDPAAYLPF